MHTLEKLEEFEELHEPIPLFGDHSSNSFVAEEMVDFALNIHDLSVWFPRIRINVVSSAVEGECRVNIAGPADLTVVGEVRVFDGEEMGKKIVSFDEFERYRWGGEDLDSEFGD
jgi:hypothetical protein